MDEYNLLSDLLDTFQSSSDYIKTVIIVTPPAFALAALYLVLRYRRPGPRMERNLTWDGLEHYRIDDRRQDPLALPVHLDHWEDEQKVVR